MKQEIDKKAIQDVIKEYMQSIPFTDRKITDTPTDTLSVVNRKYVNLNGAVADRPISSIASVGQSYYATDTNIPMTYSAGGWRNGVGSIVAANN
mgnify:CR=1 FL=1